MKSWHLIVLLIVIITTGGITVLYVQSKADDMVLCTQQISSQNQEAVDQQLQSLENLLNAKLASIESLKKSVDSKIEISSSGIIAKLTDRLESLEKSLNDNLATIESLARAQLPPGAMATVVDLDGQWESVLPSGAKRQLSILNMGDGRYKLVKSGIFSGIYQLKDGRLVVVEPLDKRLTEFVWDVKDADTLVLIKSSKKTGQDYSGATLKRLQ